MNTPAHDYAVSTAAPRRLRAKWLVWVMTLFAWSQATSWLIAGCFPSDDYRHFHHGGFFNSPSQSYLNPSATGNQLRSGEGSAVAWIYENGTLQPIANPLPPHCDGPNCRPTPNQNHLGHAITPIDGLRLVNSWSQNASCTPSPPSQHFKTNYLNESPLIGDSLAIDRPPKFF